MCNTLMGRGNVQEAGRSGRKALGIEIIAADSPGAFVEDPPTATLVRQVLGAVAELDKAMTVAKLRLARDRVRKRDGKCEGQVVRRGAPRGGLGGCRPSQADEQAGNGLSSNWRRAGKCWPRTSEVGLFIII